MTHANSRTIHGTTDSSQVYSKGAKADAAKKTIPPLPQPAPFQNPNSHSTSNKTITPTPVLPPTPAYDPFLFSSSSNCITDCTPSLDLSLQNRSPADAENNVLDPQLLTLQRSPQQTLPTPFTDPNSQIQTSIDQSPDSLPGPSPFTWNDFTFFDELNHSLGILNPTDDMQSQLDQLISSVLPSGSATQWPSTPNMSNTDIVPELLESAAPLFRIPTSNEVPIKGVHSAPPPTMRIEKKLDETAWKKLAAQVHISEHVFPPPSVSC